MTSSLFKEWLQKWNKELILKNKNILLLIDNCPTHPLSCFSNIKLWFLPKNTTSLLQPCDQGIIKCLKGKYRTHLMKRLILNHELR